MHRVDKAKHSGRRRPTPKTRRVDARRVEILEQIASLTTEFYISIDSSREDTVEARPPLAVLREIGPLTAQLERLSKRCADADTSQRVQTDEESSRAEVGAIRRFLIGHIARPDHPATCLNPSGREGFTITDVMVEEGRIAVRGDDTMWFGESAILEVRR